MDHEIEVKFTVDAGLNKLKYSRTAPPDERPETTIDDGDDLPVDNTENK
jgi:hypothetical protein